MFVSDEGTTYTYARTGEAKWIKIAHPEDEIRLSEQPYARTGEANRVKVAYPEEQIKLSEDSRKGYGEAKDSAYDGLTNKEKALYKILVGQAGKQETPGVVVITDLAKDYVGS